MIDSEYIRQDFPCLDQKINGKKLCYLDNAATTHKPQIVIDTIVKFYNQYNANIHRGVHTLSQLATDKYENARKIIQKFINAKHSEEIIWIRGATEGINLVASSYGEHFLKKGDEIIISYLEHHANIVPWQIVCNKIGAILNVVPVNEAGEIMLDEFKRLLNERTKFVSIGHISNAIGIINPIKEIINITRVWTEEKGLGNIPVLIDAAQSVQHIPVDVQALDCDFLVASGHKIYGPTGIGFLYGKKELLDKMPPYQTGGDMILSVSFGKTIYNELPYKFEAGTANIAGAIGLGKAVEYIQSIGLYNIMQYENELLDYATEQLLSIEGLQILGTSKHKSSVISFVFDDVHPHDIGTFLDTDGIAIRTGHHCAEPIIKHFKVPATSRMSLVFYNTKEEIDRLVKSLNLIVKMFR